MRSVSAIVVLVSMTAVAAADDMGGIVLDAKTGLGISGALIAADDASAESAADGSFVLAGVHTHRVAVFVFAEGYAPAEIELIAQIPGRIELRPANSAVEIIEVSGKAPDSASPTSYTFSRDQIRALPGTGNDVLRALQSMPGVSRMPFGLGGLVLRGASPNESDVYLDGIEVPLAYHFGGVTSFYPSTLLEEVVLSPGGADVNYGRGVGGIADLRSREARTDRLRVGGELGVFDASVYGESALAGGGVTLGLRRSYADAFIGQLLPDDRQVLPRYYDGQLRWDRKVGRGTFTVLGLFSDDRIVGWGGTDYEQGFARGALRYRRTIGPTTLTLMPWGGWGRMDLKYVLEHTTERPDLPQKIRLERHPVGLRGELRRETHWGHIAGGLDVQGAYVRYEQSEDVLAGSTNQIVEDGTYVDTGLWLETRWRIADGKLTLKPGLRFDYLGIAHATVIEPRVVATHELTPRLTLRETFGFHHQPPGPIAAVGTEEGRGTIVNTTDPRGNVVQGIDTSVGARVGSDVRQRHRRGAQRRPRGHPSKLRRRDLDSAAHRTIPRVALLHDLERRSAAERPDGVFVGTDRTLPDAQPQRRRVGEARRMASRRTVSLHDRVALHTARRRQAGPLRLHLRSAQLGAPSGVHEHRRARRSHLAPRLGLDRVLPRSTEPDQRR
jgi:hypothetical protein